MDSAREGQLNGQPERPKIARRLFVTQVGVGASLAGAAAIGAHAQAIRGAVRRDWEATRHVQDDWLEDIPGQHRLVVDTTSPDGLTSACQFTHSYLAANREEYGLQDNDLAILIILRHRSTSFGFTDAIWKKYGKQLSQHAEFSDPAIGRPFLNRVDQLRDHAMVSVNLRNIYVDAAGGGASGPVGTLTKDGVRFAVCKTSTRTICAAIADATGSKPDALFEELAGNLIPNARLVSAGIVIVNRAQERGYSYVHTL